VRVSIVMPVYNAIAYLGATLESALAQTHADVEIIAVDDGSTDGSWEALAAIGGDRIQRVRLPHGGGCRARNHGLGLATGERLLFLDADDLISPDLVAALSDTLDGAPAGSFAGAPWRHLVPAAAGWEPARRTPTPVSTTDPLASWLRDVWIPTSGILWPAALVRELGGWDPTLAAAQDGDLVMRALVAGARLVQSERGLLWYRDAAGSVSKGRSAEQLRSRMRVLEKVAAALETTGRLDRYRVPLAHAYHHFARGYLVSHPELARECARRATALAGRRGTPGTLPHRWLSHLLGLERKERLAAALAKLGIRRAGRKLP
jgi:glycosyltransferase involved in cell wall biosynthesis